MAQSLVLVVKSDARFARRRCGSCSVFEVTQSVYKYAPNRLSFRLRNSLMLVMMAIAVIATITVVIVTVATAIFVVTIIIAVVVIMLG